VNSGHRERCLGGERRDDAGGVCAERREGLDVGLDARSSAGIGAGDGEHVGGTSERARGAPAGGRSDHGRQLAPAIGRVNAGYAVTEPTERCHRALPPSAATERCHRALPTEMAQPGRRPPGRSPPPHSWSICSNAAAILGAGSAWWWMTFHSPSTRRSTFVHISTSPPQEGAAWKTDVL